MVRPTRRRGNLPAEATSFVGRRRELAELRKKLATVRLVTLVGPGGVGKTRLAIRMRTDLARAFPDGAQKPLWHMTRPGGMVCSLTTRGAFARSSPSVWRDRRRGRAARRRERT